MGPSVGLPSAFRRQRVQVTPVVGVWQSVNQPAWKYEGEQPSAFGFTVPARAAGFCRTLGEGQNRQKMIQRKTVGNIIYIY